MANNANISSDPLVLNFISSQNDSGARGAGGAYMPALLQNGIGGTSTDNVIGFSTLSTTSNATIALGSGYNVVVIDGAHSGSPATSGAADNFYFTVDSSGLVTLTDTNTGKSQKISGVSELIFNGAALGIDGNGNPNYASMYFIGDMQATQATEVYNAVFGRQPDLAGLEYYRNEMAAGIALTQVTAQFLASPEFSNRFAAAALSTDSGGANDQAFITQLYHNVLHRTPAASELSWYTNEIQTTFATIPNYRAILLMDFAISPENQKDTAGFIINTSGTTSEGYVFQDSAPNSQTPVQALQAAQSSGTIDTSTINMTGVTGQTSIGGTTINAPGVTQGLNSSSITTTVSNLTIYLSSSFTVGAATGSGDTIYTSPTGKNYLLFSHNGGTAYLSGQGNHIEYQEDGLNPAPLNINGFNSSDAIGMNNNYGFGTNSDTIGNFIYTPTANTQLNGISLSFGNSVTLAEVPLYLVNVGNVGSGTSAEVAAAANKVYLVADTPSEAIVFFGQTTNGSTVLYDWRPQAASAATPSADTNNNHQVDPSEFISAVQLVGFPSTSITTSLFH